MKSAFSLRIAFICPFGLRKKASASARALPLARALTQRGHKVALFVPPWDEPNPEHRVYTHQDVRVTELSVSGGHLPTLVRMLREVLEFSPDLVHFFKPIAHSAAVAQLLCFLGPFHHHLALVLDVDDWEGQGGWSEILPYRRWQKALLSRQERWSYAHAHAVTFASQALETIALSLGVPSSKLFPVPNALNEPLRLPESYDPAEMKKSLGITGPVVLLYTRFAEFSPEWPAQFMASLVRQSPECTLLVVGQGLHGEERAFQEAAKRLGVESKVYMVGFLDASHIPAHIGVADVAIVPFSDSLIARTKCSVKLVEMMSLGIPIIASAVGENVSYLDYGRAGILLEDLEPDAWAGAVRNLLGEPEKRCQLGQAAKERVRNHYLWEHRVGTVEAAYTHALKNRSPQ